MRRKAHRWLGEEKGDIYYSFYKALPALFIIPMDDGYDGKR